MRNLLLILLCLSLAGCTTLSRAKNLEKQVTGLKEALSKRNAGCNEELKMKDNQLKEKDSQIDTLCKKLEGFGVFK